MPIRRSSLLLLAPVALTIGCDDTVFPTEGTEITAEGWDGVVEVFDGECTSCHSSASASAFGDLDLETDPCAAVVGVDASGYDGVLVVAGDSSSSVLWHKVDDSGEYGGVMPTGGRMSQDTIDLVADWIDDGADCE